MVFKSESTAKKFKPCSAQQRHVVKAIKNSSYTLITGPAGSGKTLLSLWAGTQLLNDPDDDINKIYIVRLAVETCGEKIGALPGMLEDKTKHLLGPIYDNLLLLFDEGKINYMIEKKVIEVLPVSHLRGRSLNNCFVLVEEVQNLNFSMVLTVLTRLGKNSKMVLNGDPTQTDVVGACGVSAAQTLLQDIPEVAFAMMSALDVQRNPLIEMILARANNHFNLPSDYNSESKVIYFSREDSEEDYLQLPA